MPRRTCLAALALLTLALPAVTLAADWAQFRGPKRDNVSADTGLLKEWPKGGPKLAFKAEGIGRGFSSVAVAGDKIYTMGDQKDASYTYALDRQTGKKLWEAKVGRTGGNYAGTRCTPTVDGDLVYALGQFGDLVCLQAATGKERWRKNFAKDFGGRAGGWNYTESPLVDGGFLVCTPGGPKASMVALNKLTGAVAWNAALDDTAGYASPVVSNAGGVRQYVQLMAGGVVGVNAKTGKLLWRYTKFGGNTANIPTCIPLGDKGEQVFCLAGYGKAAALLTLSGSGGKVTFKEEYYNGEMRNKHGGAVIVGDLVFADTDDSGRVYCADWRTGEVKWKGNSKQGRGSASVTFADGNLYVRYDNGFVALVPAVSEGYTEKGIFKVPNGSRECWAHPVVVDGRLYLREQDTLWVHDVKGE